MVYDPTPTTFEEAVDLLFQVLDRKTMEIFAGRTAQELRSYHGTAGSLIENQFRLSDDNTVLLEDCRRASGKADLDGEQAAIYILETFWARLQLTRR